MSDQEDRTPAGDDDWISWRQDVTEDLGEIQPQLAEAREVLGKILSFLEEVGIGGPLHWETLSPKKRAALMERLADFVHFLDRVYLQHLAEYSLKPCWWRHPDVVWQLTALMAAFAHTYHPGVRPSTDQAGFHERYLWPVLDRLRSQSTMRPCNDREHKPNKQQALARSEHLAAQLEQWRNGDDVELGAFDESSVLDFGGSDGGGLRSPDGAGEPDGDE